MGAPLPRQPAALGRSRGSAERTFERRERPLVRAGGPFQHRVGHAGAKQVQQEAVVVQPRPQVPRGLLGAPAADHHHPEQGHDGLVQSGRSGSAQGTS